MTHREQIAQVVDGMIASGRIQQGMRDQYLDMMAKDDSLAQEFAGMFMRHNDYTRKTQEVAEQRRQLEAERQAELQKFQSERQALQQWERDVKDEIARLKTFEQQTPELMAKVAAYEQALTDYNLKDQVVVAPTIPTAQPQGAPAAMTQQPQSTQPAGYISRDEAEQAFRQYMNLQGTAFALAGEHQKLFGEPLTEDIVSQALAAGEPDVRKYWEIKFNAQGRRSELAAKEQEAERARIREEERQKLMAEYATDPTRVTGGQGIAPASPSLLHETYSASKALQQDGRVAPELVPPQVAQRARVDAIAKAWDQAFDVDGNPRQAGGAGANYQR